MEVYKYFRLTENEAKQIILEVTNAVKAWRDIANKYNISRNEQEIMSKAFAHANL